MSPSRIVNGWILHAFADVLRDLGPPLIAQAGPGHPGRGTRQGGGAEPPDVCQRPANLRPRHPRVRDLVLFGASSRVQRHRRPPLPDSLEHRGYAPTTINLRLAAVRRIAYDRTFLRRFSFPILLSSERASALASDYLLRFSGAETLVRHSVRLDGADYGPRPCGGGGGHLACPGAGRRWCP